MSTRENSSAACLQQAPSSPSTTAGIHLYFIYWLSGQRPPYIAPTRPTFSLITVRPVSCFSFPGLPTCFCSTARRADRFNVLPTSLCTVNLPALRLFFFSIGTLQVDSDAFEPDALRVNSCSLSLYHLHRLSIMLSRGRVSYRPMC